MCCNRLLIDIVCYEHRTLAGPPELRYWSNRTAGYNYGWYELDIPEGEEVARYYLGGRRFLNLRLSKDITRKQIDAIVQGAIEISASDIIVYDFNDHNFHVIREGRMNYPIKRLREKLMEESDRIARHRGAMDSICS